MTLFPAVVKNFALAMGAYFYRPSTSSLSPSPWLSPSLLAPSLSLRLISSLSLSLSLHLSPSLATPIPIFLSFFLTSIAGFPLPSFFFAKGHSFNFFFHCAENHSGLKFFQMDLLTRSSKCAIVFF